MPKCLSDASCQVVPCTYCQKYPILECKEFLCTCLQPADLKKSFVVSSRRGIGSNNYIYIVWYFKKDPAILYAL